jgi:hypothetical protein
VSAYNDETISFRGAGAIHEFTLVFREGWGHTGSGTVALEVGSYGIDIESDSDAQDEVEPTHASFTTPRRISFENDLSDEADKDFQDFKKALDAAWELTRLINAWSADAISAAEQREAEEEQRQRETEEARQKILDEREETMLQELVDERVKVRHKGYKTMCYAVVYVQPLYGEPQRTYKTEDDEEPSGYRARLRYSDQGETRDNGMDSYARLDAKTEKGWRTVWDDGKDDLPDYDRDVKLPKARPWNGTE